MAATSDFGQPVEPELTQGSNSPNPIFSIEPWPNFGQEAFPIVYGMARAWQPSNDGIVRKVRQSRELFRLESHHMRDEMITGLFSCHAVTSTTREAFFLPLHSTIPPRFGYSLFTPPS